MGEPVAMAGLGPGGQVLVAEPGFFTGAGGRRGGIWRERVQPGHQLGDGLAGLQAAVQIVLDWARELGDYGGLDHRFWDLRIFFNHR